MWENIREIALDALLTLEKQADYSNRLIGNVLNKYDYLPGREKAFLKRLMEGTLERRIELDYWLNRVSSVPVTKMKPLIRELLRMSLYQMLYMDGVPDSAVCNEACRIAVKRGFGGLKGFVNGVLRNLARQKGTLSLPDERKEPLRYLSVKYSMPEWIAAGWLEEYGMQITETILEGLMKVHPVSLRFRWDLSEETRQKLLKEFSAQGAVCRQSGILPYVYSLEGVYGVEKLPGFAQGLVTVQDVTSALAVEAAGICPGDFVVDVCAAPGGKSLLAAEKGAKVLSRDRTEEKAELIRQAACRMRADGVQVQVYDGRETDQDLLGRADKVFLDVPCSGLGVMGRKRDIKYRADKEKLPALEALQRQIVDASWRYVKPGGILLYSTCTINPGENEAMVKYLCETLPFEPEDLDPFLPRELAAYREQFPALLESRGKAPRIPLDERQRRACIQFLPGFTEGDGFFIARFRRRESEKESEPWQSREKT